MNISVACTRPGTRRLQALLAILGVVAILLFLIMLLIPSLQGSGPTPISTCLAHLKLIETAMESYARDHPAAHTPSLVGLAGDQLLSPHHLKCPIAPRIADSQQSSYTLLAPFPGMLRNASASQQLQPHWLVLFENQPYHKKRVSVILGDRSMKSIPQEDFLNALRATRTEREAAGMLTAEVAAAIDEARARFTK